MDRSEAVGGDLANLRTLCREQCVVCGIDGRHEGTELRDATVVKLLGEGDAFADLVQGIGCLDRACEVAQLIACLFLKADSQIKCI